MTTTSASSPSPKRTRMAPRLPDPAEDDLRSWSTQTAQHAVTVLGKASEVAIELLIPEREATQLGEMLDLIDEA